MKIAALLIPLCAMFAAITPNARAFEIQKSALYVFLHEVKPIEEEAAKALDEKNYALALRKYREALRGYERIWKDYPNLANERPHGIDHMVDESIDTCKKAIDRNREKGEAQDAFYQKLNEAVGVDFSNQDIREVAKLLTSLTDVNIIVDQTIFYRPSKTLNPKISIRTDQPRSLRTIIADICQQAGLAYSIEVDHVFISTRVKLDEQG
ncbi:hypothetical protein HZA56_19330 [Candidatus Poribacteria bacterium]|nr:hypothetical protein [Candidatus Poribacteria bacterium]